MHKFSTVVLSVITIFLLAGTVQAEAPDYRSISGLSTAKAYFDLKVGNPAKLLMRLKQIDETYNQIADNDVKPEFVIGIRGKASYFVTKGSDYVFEDEVEAKKTVHKKIKEFRDRGMLVEQCRVAAELHEIDPQDFIKNIDVVPNGYVSIIGYQAKGYSFVPMD